MEGKIESAWNREKIRVYRGRKWLSHYNKVNSINTMNAYGRDFVLLNKSYWNFSMIDDELHRISTWDENHVRLQDDWVYFTKLLSAGGKNDLN